MFSSMSGGGDELHIPSKLEKMKPVEREVNFPMDCMGIIVGFLESCETLKNLKYSSKQVKYYTEVINPRCCRNVVFKFLFPPKSTSPLLYVRNLIVDGVVEKKKKPFRKKEAKRNFENEFVVRFFPNLESLVLRNASLVTWKILEHTPNLISLSIENCPKMMSDETVHAATQLRKLKIDCSHCIQVNEMTYDSRFLSKIPNIEKIEVCQVSLSHFDKKLFQNMDKLVTLRLKRLRSYDIRDDIFEYTKNLEVLELDHCSSFGVDGFKYLKKVEYMNINSCEGLWSQFELSQQMGCKPKNFIFCEPMMMMGDIMPLELDHL